MPCTVISILISIIYCITIYTKFLLYWFVSRRGEMLGYQKVLPKGVLQTDVVLLHGLACSDMDGSLELVVVPNITTVDWTLENQKTEHIHKPNRGD